MMNKNGKYKIVLAVPTINCYSYIYDSLERIKNEVLLVPKKYETEIVIGLNGTADQGKSEREIRRFIGKNTNIEITLLIFEQAGKNITINKIIEYSKDNKADIIHFFDDDVKIEPGSLLINIEALIETQQETNAPILVGSNFYAVPKTLSFCIKQNKGFINGLAKYFIHRVFRVAFESKDDSPRFCSGQSMGMYVGKIPVIPDDDKGVMDDAYLSNFAYVYGKVIKPVDSKVYFNVAESLVEWKKQQKRIYLGVLKPAMQYFLKNEDVIDILNSWPYSHNRKWRIKPKKMSLLRRLFYMIYLYLTDRMVFEAKQECGNLLYKDWGISNTSKIFY